MDLHLSRSNILLYWAGTPDQHCQTNRLYRRMRVGAASRELSRNNGERFLAPGYTCVPRADWLRRYHDTVLPKGAHFWYKGDDRSRWLGKISASTTEDKIYLVRFLDDPGPIELPLPPARYTASTGAVRGSWCLQVHIASAFPRGIQPNVDESRGAAVTSRLPSRHRSPIVLHFVWVMRFESSSLGCLWCFESLGLVMERSFPFFFPSCRTSCLASGQGSGKTPLSEAQDCRLFVYVQFRPADALLSPEPGGDQATLFARNVV